jgi:hypothetical protein
MTLDPAIVEGIGFVSGTIIALSAFPRLFDLRRDDGKVRGENVTRNLALVIGNLGWVSVGVFKPSLSIAAMCAVAAFLNAMVLFLVMRAKRKASSRTREQLS